MPRRDGTGPMGQGAMTGRGLGVCTGVNAGGAGYGLGRGQGRGRGFGMGFGYGAGLAYGCRRVFWLRWIQSRPVLRFNGQRNIDEAKRSPGQKA
jgi:hypothetical protein